MDAAAQLREGGLAARPFTVVTSRPDVVAELLSGSEAAGEEDGDQFPDELDGATAFKGFELFKNKLYHRNLRGPELFGIEHSGGSAWTDIRYTSICGAGRYDTLYRGEGYWAPDWPAGAEDRRATVSTVVRRARDDYWFDMRSRLPDGRRLRMSNQ